MLNGITLQNHIYICILCMCVCTLMIWYETLSYIVIQIQCIWCLSNDCLCGYIRRYRNHRFCSSTRPIRSMLNSFNLCRRQNYALLLGLLIRHDDPALGN